MLLTRCPRCGQGALFSGFVTVASGCDACGLSYSGREQGDGPAYMAILLVSMVTGVFAAIVEIVASPPFWLHAILWVPFILISSLVSLRFAKAALILAQYQLRKDDFR